MRISMIVSMQQIAGRILLPMLMTAALVTMARPASAQPTERPVGAAAGAQSTGGEANLILPDLSPVDFRGINGRTLLMGGLVVSALGLAFGLFVFTQLKNLPVHESMRE